MAVHRIYNFSAGPAILPVPVLEEAQRDLLALPGVGMSVMEISHRSKTFEAIIQTAEANIRSLAGVPDNYKVLFLQGGASLQFSMVPMNLLTSGAVADYILTGSWSKKALKEAKLIGATHVAASTEEGGFKRVPAANEIKLTPGAAYVHMTSNNTIAGTEWLRRLVRSRESAGLTIVGPAPSAVERIKTRWRWHVLMKSEHPHELTRVGRYFMERFPVAARDGLRVTFDRDPVTLL